MRRFQNMQTSMWTTFPANRGGGGQFNMTLLLLHHIEHFDCSKLLHGIRGCNRKMLVKITKDWE